MSQEVNPDVDGTEAPKPEVYGYIRVSSKDQNEARQILALREAGVPRDRIYTDKQSGKNFDRPEYVKLMQTVKPGDIIFFKSIDRMGRNYDEIIQQWSQITREKLVDIVILDMPILDTRTDKNLVGRFVSDIVLQILSFVAENERVNIRQRQAEGIAAAKARGVRLGRKPRPKPENFLEMFRKWKNGEISGTKAAKECGMPLSTFREMARKEEST